MLIVSIISFFIIGYVVLLISNISESTELVLGIIAGLQAVVIVLGVTLINKIKILQNQNDKNSTNTLEDKSDNK